MCGIAGIVSLDGREIDFHKAAERVFYDLLKHRGPDGSGSWLSRDKRCMLFHARLSILDLSQNAMQPMKGGGGTCLVHNGEVYNYKALRRRYSERNWISNSDSESILASYEDRLYDCVEEIEGMFSFAIWDEKRQSFFAARDRVGIKPFYYLVVDGKFIFASEPKALLPFLEILETDYDALGEYVCFQYTLGDKTLFKGIKQLLPGHRLAIRNGKISINQYWDLSYQKKQIPDIEVEERLKIILGESVNDHLQSDVPIGTYLSGGVDSSLVAILAKQLDKKNSYAFHGKFVDYSGYDESEYAKLVAKQSNLDLHQLVITSDDFINYIGDVVYYLDFPSAGPGSFPQYMVSKLASENVKVVLGGQGGDELFGGYARYLLLHLEQSLSSAFNGQESDKSNIQLSSLVGNLSVLKEYRPLITSFLSKEPFGSIDDGYFRLIDRSRDYGSEFNWESINMNSVKSRFSQEFYREAGIHPQAYMEYAMRFDFKFLLPALLHVEDRVSMAHGIESRVPLLDRRIVEFSSSLTLNQKMPNAQMKFLLKNTFNKMLPSKLISRRDKMGFPVPLNEWYKNEIKDFVCDTFASQKTLSRDMYNAKEISKSFQKELMFSRKTWAFLCLELWQQSFHDRFSKYRDKLNYN